LQTLFGINAHLNMDLDDYSGYMLEQMEVVMPTGGRPTSPPRYSRSNQELADAVRDNPTVTRTLSFLDPEKAEELPPRADPYRKALISGVIILLLLLVILSVALVFLCIYIIKSQCSTDWLANKRLAIDIALSKKYDYV
jgi:hypothetical protein